MTLSLERYADRPPRATDAATVAVLFGFALLGGSLHTSDHPRPDRLTPVLLLSAVSCLALLDHRRHPRTALAVTVVCAMIAGALGYLLAAAKSGPATVPAADSTS